MFEKIIVKNVLVAEFLVADYHNYKFEKYVEGGTVRVFVEIENEFREVNMFTNYEIQDNVDRFEEACLNYLKELYEEEE